MLVHVGSHQAIALVDSVSSKTFIDKDFVYKKLLQTQATAARKVMVAGGGELISDSTISDC